ncbi:MAG: hypothetical protein IPP72_19295 [Chitinophagaceae bacterium]|nr:hypothetical protein [Chitinophagaceae bacterium]
MATKKPIWKKGRGKLGILQPLLGTWIAETDSPMGKLKCTRSFKLILSGQYIELNAKWEFSKGVYEEQAVYGMNDGMLSFWSFTSDGKKSQGAIADGKDVHAEAICFEANMPAGMARMIYWPSEDGGFYWAVESKVKKGWNRFTKHHYHSL